MSAKKWLFIKTASEWVGNEYNSRNHKNCSHKNRARCSLKAFFFALMPAVLGCNSGTISQEEALKFGEIVLKDEILRRCRFKYINIEVEAVKIIKDFDSKKYKDSIYHINYIVILDSFSEFRVLIDVPVAKYSNATNSADIVAGRISCDRR